MTINIFTHSDLDGCGCVVLARSVYRNQLKSTKFCNYDNIDKELSSFLDKKAEEDAQQEYPDTPLLFISDICPSDATLKKIDQTPHLMPVLLDHHKTKEKILSKYSWAKFDKDRCGTELVLDYLNNTKSNSLGPLYIGIEEWVKACSAWDLWKLDSPYRKRGEQLNALCFFLGMEEFVDVFSKNINADQLPEFQNLLNYLENNKNKYVDKIIKEQLHHTEYCMDGFGNTFKIVFASEYISEIGQAALADEDSEDLHYIVIVNPLNNTISLRSRGNENIDVAKIAVTALHGGGHFHAAGAPLDMKKSIKNKVFKILNSANG